MFSMLRTPLVQNFRRICVERSQHVRCVSKISGNENPKVLQKDNFHAEMIKSTVGNVGMGKLVYPTDDGLIDRSDQFLAFFPNVVKEIVEVADKFDSTGVGGKHLERALLHTGPRGKKIRGNTVVRAFERLAPKSEVTEENIKLAMYLGWCIELLQTMYVIIDDICDDGEVRRGRTSWFRLEDVKLSAGNDGILIESTLYLILRKYFSHMKCYVKLLELFQEVTFITSVGESSDIRIEKQDIFSLSLEEHREVATNKTGYYTFYLPVVAAMLFSGIEDPDLFSHAENIFIEMNIFYQAQDDYMDCFGDPVKMGKVGKDIQDGKISWMVLKAIELANDEQKQTIKKYFGKRTDESAQKIKDLYLELDLPKHFDNYEAESYKRIMSLIEQTTGMSKAVYLDMLRTLYKRVV